MSEEILYVRLKPYDPQAGHLVRRYIYKGMSFATDTASDRPVWNKMTLKKVNELGLRELLQPRSAHSTHQPPLLDIMSEEEYKATEGKDRERHLAALGLLTETQVAIQPDTAVIDRTREKSGRDAAIPEPEIVPAMEAPPSEVKVIEPAPVPIEGDESEPPLHTSAKRVGRPRGKSKKDRG